MAANGKVLPNFLGIGSPKCGTTWLYLCLREHPEIYLPFIKEVHYFDRYHEKGPEWYERYFRAWKGQKAVGEITATYLYDEKAPERICRELPDARLIVTLRNPIDRAYSRYRHHYQRGNRARTDFETALRENKELLRDGYYFRYLRKYLSVFPRERLLVLFLEEMRKDPLATFGSIFRFLGVDPHFVPKNVSEEVAPQFVTMPVYDQLSKVSVFLREKAGLGALIDGVKRSPVLPWFDGVFSRYGYQKEEKKAGAVVDVPAMREETRGRLAELYREDTEALAAFLGRRIECWK
jgi:hypothetical protein